MLRGRTRKATRRTAAACCMVNPICEKNAFILALVCFGAANGAMDAQEQKEERSSAQKGFSWRPSARLILLGVMAFCSLLSIGALFDWSSVYVVGTLRVEAGLAAAGFTAFLLCMTLKVLSAKAARYKTRRGMRHLAGQGQCHIPLWLLLVCCLIRQ